MEFFAQSIQKANISLQAIVEKQRSKMPPGYAKARFNDGKWELLGGRLQYLDSYMQVFNDSFEK